MGKRFWGGVAILAVLFALGLWVAKSMETTHKAVARHLEQAAREALTGDTKQGQESLQKAQELWQQRRFLTAAVADHGPMEEIDSILSQLESLAEADDGVSFAAWCRRAARLVEAIGEAQKLTWQNLL